MLNSPQQFLSGLASSNYPTIPVHPSQQHNPFNFPSSSPPSGGYQHPHHHLGGNFHSTAMMHQGGAGFGMVAARAALMPTPVTQHTGVNGGPPPHPHHPVSLGLEVRYQR